jgi:hypothetical protein
MAGRAAMRSVFALSSPYVKRKMQISFKRLGSGFVSSQMAKLFTIDSNRPLESVEESGFVSSFLYLGRTSLSGFVFALLVPAPCPFEVLRRASGHCSTVVEQWVCFVIFMIAKYPS